jgi:hypothetical protein
MSIPTSITDGRNPTYLDPRYEIRQLTVAHTPWAAAIVIHSNMFHSPIWPVLYPDEKTKRVQQGMGAVDYLVRHQIESGMSFGIFDTQYEYKRPGSALTQGKLYWDPNDVKSDGASLLQQMDFPLVSVALSYDASNPLDMQRLMHLVEVLPADEKDGRLADARSCRPRVQRHPDRNRTRCSNAYMVASAQALSG